MASLVETKAVSLEENGDPGEIRTPDRVLRTDQLYPAELRGQPSRELGKSRAAPATCLRPARLDTPAARGPSCAGAAGRTGRRRAWRKVRQYLVARGVQSDRALAHARRRLPLGRHLILLTLIWICRRLCGSGATCGILGSALSHAQRRRHVGRLFRRPGARCCKWSATPRWRRRSVGLLFAFSGQLGRSLARIFNLGAAHHVVIAGDSAGSAFAGARLPQAQGFRDPDRRTALPDETALGLRRKGVIVMEGDATHDRNAAHRARASRRARRRVTSRTTPPICKSKRRCGA